jgi:hypothetical protein
MKLSTIALITVCLCALSGGIVPVSDAATNFNGSTITNIDQGQRTITFRTREGQSWTLPVVDPELLKTDRLSQGDQVSIEIDLNDQIIKILKPSDFPQAARTDNSEANQ